VPWLRLGVAGLLPRRLRVRSQVSPCGICGGQSGVRQVFLRVLRFSAVIVIPWFSVLIYRVWPQFGDIVTAHGHEQLTS
jgi:hypothetical protein